MMLGLVILAWIIFFEALTFLFSQKKQSAPVTHLLLLGANGDAESNVNQERAQLALLARKLYPHAALIISGNEHWRREVTALRKNLGPEAASALQEGQSRTTYENMVFSKRLLPKDASLLVITSGFHRRRAVTIARLCGLKANGFAPVDFHESKKTNWWIRERFATTSLVFGFVNLWVRNYQP